MRKQTLLFVVALFSSLYAAKPDGVSDCDDDHFSESACSTDGKRYLCDPSNQGTTNGWQLFPCKPPKPVCVQTAPGQADCSATSPPSSPPPATPPPATPPPATPPPATPPPATPPPATPPPPAPPAPPAAGVSCPKVNSRCCLSPSSRLSCGPDLKWYTDNCPDGSTCTGAGQCDSPQSTPAEGGTCSVKDDYYCETLNKRIQCNGSVWVKAPCAVGATCELNNDGKGSCVGGSPPPPSTPPPPPPPSNPNECTQEKLGLSRCVRGIRFTCSSTPGGGYAYVSNPCPGGATCMDGGVCPSPPPPPPSVGLPPYRCQDEGEMGCGRDHTRYRCESAGHWVPQPCPGNRRCEQSFPGSEPHCQGD